MITEFENLKRSYISTVNWGLTARVGYNQSKRWNDILHRFCENLVDNSNYNEVAKASMKNELEIVKEALSKEIELFYKEIIR